MTESVKINRLEIENVKRIKAVKLEPTANGLTVIGGKNGQGKTSVLDSIAWVLGGEKYKPSKAQRDDSVIPPNLNIVLSNGLIVERKGKNSTLKVTDPNGKKGGQQLLNEFVESLALDLPKFMSANDKEKANTLLQIIGVGNELSELEMEETKLYNERLAIGRIADQKEKYANEQIHYEGVPEEPISAKDLINQQQEILARNGENQRKREKVNFYNSLMVSLSEEVARLEKTLIHKKEELQKTIEDYNIAQKDALDLIDQSTEELERSIEKIDEINRKVRANQDKKKAEEEAKKFKDDYANLTSRINDVRTKKTKLLKGADLPLPDLTVENGVLKYKNQEWDNMSGSEQLKVATAIVRKLNPKCGFVLLDKLEQMDLETMNEFGKWLSEEGLQVIATRVSTGEECSIIIEDGYVVNEKTVEKPKWKVGEF